MCSNLKKMGAVSIKGLYPVIRSICHKYFSIVDCDRSWIVYLIQQISAGRNRLYYRSVFIKFQYAVALCICDQKCSLLRDRKIIGVNIGCSKRSYGIRICSVLIK